MIMAEIGLLLLILSVAGVVLDMFFEFDLWVCRCIACVGILGAVLILINLLILNT